MGASSPRPHSAFSWRQVCPTRNTQGCARASVTGDSDADHARACLWVPSRASSGPKRTHRS